MTLPLEHRKVIVRYGGYIIRPGVDLLEYADYYGKAYRLEDIDRDLEARNLPPGLILRNDNGGLAMVADDRMRLVDLRSVTHD